MLVQLCLGVKYVIDNLPSDSPVKCAEITLSDVYLSQSGLVKIYEPFQALSNQSLMNDQFARYQQGKLSSVAPEQINPKATVPITQEKVLVW